VTNNELTRTLLAAAALVSTLGGCGDSAPPAPRCEIAEGAPAPDFLQKLGCADDFRKLASDPLDATLPGARSVKVVLDQLDKDTLYFQNSNKFKIHHQFASRHLSGPRLPLVPALPEFNRTEYTSPQRRFLLGAVTYYETPRVWAFEIAPYDTASAAMIGKVFDAVRASAFFGGELAFHPTSEQVVAEAKALPSRIRVVSTETLFAATDYQPLNLGETVGQLRFVKAEALPTTYLSFRDVVVLDQVPNDISVVAGIISEQFQTPLSHINVLAGNRGTPNMGLRRATSNAALRALDGKWVRLTVGPFEYELTEVTAAEAEQWWLTHKPTPITVPPLDLTVTDLRNIEEVVKEGGGVPLRQAISNAVKAFGAKAAGYSVLKNTPGVPIRKAFAIPVVYYVQFMQDNGFRARVDALLADAGFREDAAVRTARLKELRDDILKAPIDGKLQALLRAKLDSDFPGQTMRFRTSTNAEDLDGFLCAGCYDSHTGDPANWEGSLLRAIRRTWATVWNFRTFEERSYRSIDHNAVAMALLVHHNFPNEVANGVAITANPLDATGLQPGFYINVQQGGEAEVVAPPPGVTSDEFILAFGYPGQPVSFVSRSNLIPPGTTVLTPPQVQELGMALDLIHKRFSPAYGPAAGNTGFYGLEVDFKFDAEGFDEPRLFVKQARPYRGRGTTF
jgi:pyruvate,water dikinase